jgi:hypothetical protein
VAEDRVEQARTPTDVLMEEGMVFFLLWLVIAPTAAPLRARVLPSHLATKRALLFSLQDTFICNEKTINE